MLNEAAWEFWNLKWNVYQQVVKNTLLIKILAMDSIIASLDKWRHNDVI